MTLDEWLYKLTQKVEIKVGFPKDKQVIYPPDDRIGHKNKGGQTVAQVATWNEFGTKTKKGKTHTPSRPFLRYTLKKNKDAIRTLLVNYFLPKNINDQNYLEKIGITMKNMVIDSILTGPWEPNAPSTQYNKLHHAVKQRGNINEIKRKMGKTRPLVDRGIMKNSVNYEVKVT